MAKKQLSLTCKEYLEKYLYYQKKRMFDIARKYEKKAMQSWQALGAIS